MINDKLIRTVFIPLLGIFIPLVSGFYNYENYSLPEIIIANCYSVFISFCVWQGGSMIIYKTRKLLPKKPFLKIISLCFLNIIYAAVVATVLSGIWLFSTAASAIDWQILLRNTIVVCVAVVVFTLIYEVLFLYSENEVEHSKTNLLHTALTKAELTVLKNELDPHFMYNALNTLSYLVKKDAQKADEFIVRLADVYRYFLINRSKEYVTLREELEFIDKYFFLLQLRYENKIELKTALHNYNLDAMTILPCALQLLVENAIKHNGFSKTDPLSIKIFISDQNIYVVNTKRPCKSQQYSTKLGLNNLKARYQLVCDEPITVRSGRDYFVVRLPLLKTA